MQGTTVQEKKKVILIPTVKVLFQDAEKEKEANFERHEKGFLAPHGFATAMQMFNFLGHTFLGDDYASRELRQF